MNIVYHYSAIVNYRNLLYQSKVAKDKLTYYPIP